MTLRNHRKCEAKMEIKKILARLYADSRKTRNLNASIESEKLRWIRSSIDILPASNLQEIWQTTSSGHKTFSLC